MRDRPPARLVEVHSDARVRLEGNGQSGFIARILDRELSRVGRFHRSRMADFADCTRVGDRCVAMHDLRGIIQKLAARQIE